MNLYNSFSNRIEPFKPRAQPITMYVCGITPYDTTHLGHAFTYTSADVLIRYLESQGHSVRYVQNVTDIDDDILRKAKVTGQDWQELGNRWTSHFIRDMITLNARPPEVFPRATDVIEQIIEHVEALLDAEVAYEVNGSVYFSIDAWPEFGELSGLARSEMLPIANERGNNPDDPQKNDPLDFVLWQAQTPGEPAWDSPWGPGRPGWHIECSTMATNYLGDTIDIHLGGSDLLFPHHECEIAQVIPVTRENSFVRYWLHVAMVRHEGEKMSKSLGNLVMVRDLLENWSPDALRLYLGSHHYRAPWSHNVDQLEEMAALAERIPKALAAESGSGEALDPAPFADAFTQAMDHDLDSPNAVRAVEEFTARIEAAADEGRSLHSAQRALREIGRVFGLRMGAENSSPGVIEGWQAHLQRFSHEAAQSG